MSKHLRAFRTGANVLAFSKDNKNYAMTCAWAMMIDYQKIAMLIGSQSITGQNLSINQQVGVSALADGQQEIAKIIGTNHSNEIDKFATISYTDKDNMLLINNAKVVMECVVESIQNLDGDLLVFLKVNNFEELKDVDYLDGYDPKNYE
jgi:flavin reductase (DIM6/NTAB) family NADH-FMN oxidoreductase RutF